MCKASSAETFPRGGSKDLFPSLSFKSFTSWYCLVCQIFLGIFQIMVHSRCSIVLQPSSWLLMLPLLQSRVSWCPAHVLHLCFKHPIFSRGACVPVHRTGVSAHTDTSMGGGDQGWMAQGQPCKVPKYLKKQHSTDVQLTPNTFKKPSPQSLPACSTQTTSQCLLLYLSSNYSITERPQAASFSLMSLHYQEVLSPILKWQLYILTVSSHLLTRFLLP